MTSDYQRLIRIQDDLLNQLLHFRGLDNARLTLLTSPDFTGHADARLDISGTQGHVMVSLTTERGRQVVNAATLQFSGRETGAPEGEAQTELTWELDALTDWTGPDALTLGTVQGPRDLPALHLPTYKERDLHAPAPGARLTWRPAAHAPDSSAPVMQVFMPDPSRPVNPPLFTGFIGQQHAPVYTLGDWRRLHDFGQRLHPDEPLDLNPDQLLITVDAPGGLDRLVLTRDAWRDLGGQDLPSASDARALNTGCEYIVTRRFLFP